MFFNILKYSRISDIEYDPSDNSNLSFHVVADKFKFVLLYFILFLLFYIFHCINYAKI